MLSRACRNIKLVIGYDGADYRGWQRQKNTENTVQQVLEETLSKILKEKIRVTGSGRTDAGAHALRQVANFKTTNFSIPAYRFEKILNDSLPPTIRVISSEEVSPTFNARFSAKFRKYIYLVFLGNRTLYPFVSRYSYIPPKRDYNLPFLKGVARDFLGEHDFLPLSSLREYKTTVRFVKSVRVFRFRDFLVFSITANGFMYNMARGIVSVMLEAEKARDELLVRRVLSGEVKIKPTLVSPNGLYLHRVYF